MSAPVETKGRTVFNGVNYSQEMARRRRQIVRGGVQVSRPCPWNRHDAAHLRATMRLVEVSPGQWRTVSYR